MSGRMTRSAELWEMSRSCHSATSSSATWALPRTTPGEAADLLAGDGVALVGHGAGAFLPDGKELFGLADLGALEVTDLGGDLIEAWSKGRRGW